MKPPTLGLADKLRAGHVKRWHLINTSRDQTLAEHAYMVAVIAVQLYRQMSCTIGGLPPHFLEAALMHDASEVRTGDIPTPGKKLIKAFAGDGVFDEIDEVLWGGAGMPHMNPDYYKYIHVADLIEAATWIRENGVGPRAAEVAAKCWEAMEAEVIALGPVWVENVNYVLSAFLCPRIRSELS